MYRSSRSCFTNYHIKFLLIGISLIAFPSMVYSQQVMSYEESFEDFPNPERGFYRYSATESHNYVTLNADELKSYRSANTIDGSDYAVVSALVFRYFGLEDFVDKPISPAYLDSMKVDFEAARQGGVKLIPRFVYTTTAPEGNCGQWICPPYGDASKEIILTHIDQLKPLWNEYVDVIALLQKGFIGTWGEQYYTDHFGDASSYNGKGKLLNKNWEDRNQVLKALLEALPSERMIQVRYPQQKQRYLMGIDAPTDSPPLLAENAYNYSDAARIGHYNDCFLSSYSDVGTYSDYGNDYSEKAIDTTYLKPYLSLDSEFTVVGGETCRDDWTPFNKCDGNAVQEFERMHYSFLNAHYNNAAVNNHWVEGGCIEEIKRRLGYRFVLRRAQTAESIFTGDSLKISVMLENVGFAAPFNPRPVKLVLRKKGSLEEYQLDAEADPRFWGPGEHLLEFSVLLPQQLKAGEYELLLNLPDASSQLHTNPDFSIRLGNVGVWEEQTGFNTLGLSLFIES